MIDTNKLPQRGRPRRFDPDQAIATAQALFHAQGYDAVSVAEVTQALGINPPSLYAAFGNKIGLYARVLDHYAGTGAVPLARILRPDRPLAEALAEVLVEAARCYTADPARPGCLVLEGLRSNDRGACEAAKPYHAAAEAAIRDYIAARHPEDAARLTDFITTSMAGLSASARDGHGPDRLMATARLAGLALAQARPT
jgi:TetR/AcrR family transcriptional regulator, repressor for divergent bdcA